MTAILYKELSLHCHLKGKIYSVICHRPEIGEFKQTEKDECRSLSNFSKKLKKGTLPNSFCKTKMTLIPKPKALHKSKFRTSIFLPTVTSNFLIKY